MTIICYNLQIVYNNSTVKEYNTFNEMQKIGFTSTDQFTVVNYLQINTRTLPIDKAKERKSMLIRFIEF
jgi:hypothetical protein